MSKEYSSEGLSWYCVQAQVKREHIASANIRAYTGNEVFCPRISFVKKTRTGKKRFTEALFPGYVFVNCRGREDFRHIMSISGVKCFVHFGDDYPAIPNSVIDSISLSIGGEKLESPEPKIKVGEDVVVLEGPFANFTAKVSKVHSGQQRVEMLFDLLGQELSVTMSPDNLMPKEYAPRENLMAVR